MYVHAAQANVSGSSFLLKSSKAEWVLSLARNDNENKKNTRKYERAHVSMENLRSVVWYRIPVHDSPRLSFVRTTYVKCAFLKRDERKTRSVN